VSRLGKPLWHFSINTHGSSSTRSPFIPIFGRKSGPHCKSDFGRTKVPNSSSGAGGSYVMGESSLGGWGPAFIHRPFRAASG
jgi:hypothetical protein